MDLDAYRATPIAGGPAAESPWIDAGSAEVPSGLLLLADPMFIDQWTPLAIRPGALAVRVRFLDVGGRWLVARLWVGGTLLIDSAQVGICDHGRYAGATWGLSNETWEARLAATTTGSGPSTGTTPPR